LGAKALAGLLLLIPMVGLALVPTYAHKDPYLWGFPFFYWYQFLWVPLTSILLYIVYRRIK
jgi:hypothetical protein